MEEKAHEIVDFMMVTEHFFHSLKEWIGGMDDLRNQRYITYTQADLNYMAILKKVCRQHSIREMEDNFNNETYIATLRLLGKIKKWYLWLLICIQEGALEDRK